MSIRILCYRYGFLTLLGCTKAYDVIFLKVLEPVNELYCCLLQIYMRGCVLEKVNVSKMNPNTIKNPVTADLCWRNDCCTASSTTTESPTTTNGSSNTGS